MSVAILNACGYRSAMSTVMKTTILTLPLSECVYGSIIMSSTPHSPMTSEDQEPKIAADKFAPLPFVKFPGKFSETR